MLLAIRRLYVFSTVGSGNTSRDERSNDYDHDLTPAYDAVYSLCKELIANPQVIELKEIRELLSDEADKLGISVPDSLY